MKTTHSSKALLLEASVLVFRRRFPGEPKAEGGQDHNAEAWDAFWVGHQDSPAHGGLPRPSPHVEIRTVFNGCWVKALSCGEEAVGHWQWSSMALIHHGRLQGGLLGETVSTQSSATWRKRGEAIKNVHRLLLYITKGIHAH